MKTSPISVPLILKVIDKEKERENKENSPSAKQMHEYTIFVLNELLEDILKKSDLGEEDV